MNESDCNVRPVFKALSIAKEAVYPVDWMWHTVLGKRRIAERCHSQETKKIRAETPWYACRTPSHCGGVMV
jgi:hypothetical protein